MRTLFGIPKSDNEFDKILIDKFTIESRHAHLHVSLDGEVVTMQTPLVYASRASELRVMVPGKRAS